jgi:hypothetical protein
MLRTDALCVSVGMIAVVGAATHAAVAGSSQGAMAWTMAVMAILCLAGLGQLRRTDKAVRRVAVHLSVMSGGMALVHAAWLLLAGGQQAGRHDHAAPAMSGSGSHGSHLLAVILVELICMAAATYICRHLASRARALEPIL